MNNFILKDYNLSYIQIFQSLFISEYGLRHLSESGLNEQQKWGHRIIAVIELCPLIGLVATVIEAVVVKYIQPYAPISPLVQQPPVISNLKRKWLFKGTQSGCDGDVSLAKVESIRAKLNQQSAPGIKFNSTKVSDYIKGGTCTAMSLEFLDSFFKIQQACIQNSNPQSEIWANRISQIGSKFALSSREMRTRQAAYNTIEVRKVDSEIDLDYSRNKIQSLANYHSLKIDYASDEIDIQQINEENELSSSIDTLPDGAFLIRILKLAHNEKLEERGHSLVYIKEKGFGCFYDPNYGARNLLLSEHSSVLFEGFKRCFQNFGIDKVRLYRLQSAAI